MVEGEQQNCMVNVHIKEKVLSFAKSIAKDDCHDKVFFIMFFSMIFRRNTCLDFFITFNIKNVLFTSVRRARIINICHRINIINYNKIHRLASYIKQFTISETRGVFIPS